MTSKFKKTFYEGLHEGMIFMIASANGRGSTVECAPAAEVKVITSFLKEAVERLQNVDDPQIHGSQFLLAPPKSFSFFK